MTLIADAERFYDANRTTVDRLVAELKAVGATEGCLDELIHEGAESASAPSEDASFLNNQGMAMQIACILDGNGDAGERIVREAAGISTPAP